VRLTPRGRRLVIALGLMLAALVGMVGGRATAAAVEPVAAVRTVVVGPGDTMWGFAKAVAEPGEDVRDVVLAIQELNGMRTAALVAGEPLLLPVP
jgi:hypothetical protein